MKFFIIGFALSNARFIDDSPAGEMDKKADGLCRDFFRDFHGVMNPDLVTNVEINNGHQGNVSLKIISWINPYNKGLPIWQTLENSFSNFSEI